MFSGQLNKVILIGAAFTLNPYFVAITEAQEGQSLALEEIIVSARKRDETLTEVPLSIAVLSDEDLKNAGLTELEALASFTPNLDFQNVGNTQPGRWNSAIRFRGMEVDISIPTNQTGGFFVDGVPVLGGASAVSFSDIASIEVIRGPQPIYFGRGTFGGAINYTSITPGHELAGAIKVSYSPTFGSNDVTAWVEGGLTDTISARLTAYSRSVGSAFDSVDGGELGEEETTGISAIFAFEPNDELMIKARIAYSEDDDGSPAASMIPFVDPNNSNLPAGSTVNINTASGPETINTVLPYFRGNLPYSENLLTRNTDFFTSDVTAFDFSTFSFVTLESDVNSREFISRVSNAGAPDLSDYGLKSELTVASFSVDYSLSESLTLSGLVGYSERASGNLRDSDGYSGEGWITKSHLTLESTSVEARLAYNDGGPFRIIGGVSYIELDQVGDIDGGWNFFPQFGVFGYGISALDLVNIETEGLFLSVEYDITDKITAIAEARYQKETVDSAQASHVTGAVIGSPTVLKSNSVLPRFSLTYAPFEGASAYFSYAEAELPGTVNTLDPAFPGYDEIIEEETLKSFELGWKQKLLDDSIFIAASIFSQEWDNMKSTDALLRIDGSFYQPIVPGSSTQEGIELELTWNVTENLSTQASYGYTNSEYKDYKLGILRWAPTSEVASVKGNTLARSPKQSAAVGITWSDELNQDWSYSVRGDVVYRGKTFADAENFVSIAGYTLFNLRANFENEQGISVGIYCNNCAEEEGWGTGVVTSNFVAFPTQGAVVDPITPRELGVSVGYQF